MVFSAWDKIKKRQFSPIYLVYGTERYLIDKTRQIIIDNVLNNDDTQFNLSIYDLGEIPIDIALEDAETAPFFSDQRLIILQNPFFLTAQKSNKKIEHNLQALITYLEKPSPTSVIVFLANYEKLDERRKITKQLKSNATIIEAKKLTKEQLIRLVNNQLKDSSVTITEEALELLRNLVEDDLSLIINELQKLILYVGENNEIDINVVEKLVIRSLEQNVFNLIEKVINGNLESAFQIYYDLLKQNEEPIKILAIIASQFRLIYQVKELARRGYGERQIASHLKVHPYRVKLARGQINSFSEENLAEIMNLLADSDYALKTGTMERRLVIEMFLFKLKQLL